MSQLKKAQELEIPSRDKVLIRDSSVQSFWNRNRKLLVDAWEEWDKSGNSQRLPLNLIDQDLRVKVEEAWENPEKEEGVKELIEEVCPGVYQFQFFSLDQIKVLREYLDKVEQSNIPLRPPYGIVLNRKGAMLDQRSEGYLAAPSFQNFYQNILDIYMRPIARMLFPEITGYDGQTFGFSIQYQPGKDTSIQMHTDASSVTLNINLNLPGEEFSGSEVDFHDPQSGTLKRVKFEPGKAIIHKGSVAHSAQPITSGERTNLVLWLYGEQMQVQRHGQQDSELTPKERWLIPKTKKDDYAPF